MDMLKNNLFATDSNSEALAIGCGLILILNECVCVLYCMSGIWALIGPITGAS